MASKDHELAAAARAKKVKSPSPKAVEAPLPDAKGKVQQGAAADLQGNVGNSGVKDMIDREARTEKKGAPAPAKDPAGMGHSEIAAKAKADAKALADKQGAGEHGHKKPAAGAKGKMPAKQAENTDKHALEKEASQKKKEAHVEKQKAAEHKSKKADPGKKGAKGAHAPAAHEAHGHGIPKATTGEKKAEAKADGGKAKAKHGADAKGAHAAPGHAKAAKPAKAVKPIDPKAEHAEHAESHAKDKKVHAKDAKAEAARAAADAAKAKDPKTGAIEHGKITAAAAKKRHAVQKESQAEDAEKKAAGAKAASIAEKKPTKAAVPAHRAAEEHKGHTDAKGAPAGGKTAPSAHADAGKSAKETGPGVKGAKPKGADPAAKAEALQAKSDSKKEAKIDEKVTAERKHEEVRAARVKAETIADVAHDPTRKAAASAEAEAKAKEEEAAGKKVDAKAHAVHAVDEEVAHGIEVDEIARAADLPQGDGQRVTLVGIYMPRPQAGGHQMLGHVSVMIGGIEVRLGNDIRALSEILDLSGETVAITGKLDLRSSSGMVDPKKKEKPILTDLSNPARR